MSTPNGMLPPRLWPLRVLLMMCGLAIVPSYQGTASSAEIPTACVPLLGIASNATGSLDPKAFVDLDAVKVSLELEPFDPTSPVLLQIVECSAGLETPIAMRSVLAIDTALFSVSSMFHSNFIALDIFGDKKTSDARRRCPTTDEHEEDARLLFDLHFRAAIVYTLVYSSIRSMPYCTEKFEAIMEEQGLPLSLVMGDDTTVDTPWGLAKAYVEEVLAYLLENDGWNADGSMGRNFNRIPFSDYSVKDSAGNIWTPYQPQNSPYKLTKRRRWQPLIESNGLGYLSTQEHVTPHIGVTARFFGFSSTQDEEAFASRELAQPEYRSRYDEVAQEALDESAVTADDDLKKAAISFFDNKVGSLLPLKAVFFAGDKLGDTLVEAYAGPGQGVQTIKASEWEPFIRTMPHSEFPSASSCLCQAFTEQVANYVGADDISPPVELGPFSYSSWSAISRDCGDSRVWGGMHFEGAVPAGVELCGGGDMAASIHDTLGRLVAGDEDAAVFKRDIGELMLRPL